MQLGLLLRELARHQAPVRGRRPRALVGLTSAGSAAEALEDSAKKFELLLGLPGSEPEASVTPDAAGGAKPAGNDRTPPRRKSGATVVRGQGAVSQHLSRMNKLIEELGRSRQSIERSPSAPAWDGASSLPSKSQRSIKHTIRPSSRLSVEIPATIGQIIIRDQTAAVKEGQSIARIPWPLAYPDSRKTYPLHAGTRRRSGMPRRGERIPSRIL
jgi:hypothetical protein